MSMAGHNNPTPQDLAGDTLQDLGKFLADNPVIETPDQAKDAGLLIERTRKLFQDMEDARKRAVTPINDKAKAINNSFREVRGPLDNIFTTLRLRLTDYTAREEAKRIRAAEEARQAAAEAEAEARKAEQAEKEAKQNASLGEVTDVAAAIVDADQKFAAYQKAGRASAVAERDVTVRLPSQLGGRALSMRTTETLVLDDCRAALECMGLTPKITEAVLSAARDYKRTYGKLPTGVRATYSRSI